MNPNFDCNALSGAEAPKVLGVDAEERVFAMEYLEPAGNPLGKHQLRDGHVDVDAARLHVDRRHRVADERREHHRPPGHCAVHDGRPDRQHGERADGEPERVHSRVTRPATHQRTPSVRAASSALSRPITSRNRRPDADSGTTPCPTSLVTATTRRDVVRHAVDDGHLADAEGSEVLAEDVEVGPYSVIGENVELGSGTRIGPHVVVSGPTRIGRGRRTGRNTTCVSPPDDSSRSSICQT